MNYSRRGVKMKVAIDVDAVLLDYEKDFYATAEIFDIERCRGNGIIYPDELYIQNKYDWDDEEKGVFIKENLADLSKNAIIMPKAAYVINQLKNANIEFIIVSTRGSEGKEQIDIVMKKFLECHLTFEKYYWNCGDKLKICQEENVDFIIDDSPSVIEKTSNHRIKSIYFRGITGYDIQHSKYIFEVNNWGSVYRILIENAQKGSDINE